MDEHPGDTLGKRFLTFWGALSAIAAVALLLALYRFALPSDDQERDGGAGEVRQATAESVRAAQKKEFNTVAEVEAGKVRIPADAAIPYAATVLAASKAKPGPIMTPEGTAAKAATTHDPNVSEFEKGTK